MEKTEISKKNLSFGILYIIVKIPVPKTDFRNRKWNRFFSFLLTGTGPEPSVPVPVPGIFRNRRTLISTDLIFGNDRCFDFNSFFEENVRKFKYFISNIDA